MVGFKILHHLNDLWSTPENGEEKYEPIIERLFKKLQVNKVVIPKKELTVLQIGTTIREVGEDSTLITVKPNGLIELLEVIGR